MPTTKDNRLVVGDLSWAADIPEWLLDMVRTERIVQGLAGILHDTAEHVGDAEVLIYLMTSSQRAPMPSALCELMVWITGRIMERKHDEEPERKLPPFLAEKQTQGLSRQEEFELAELRSMIYSKRGGTIAHPLLDALRMFKKELAKQSDGPVQQTLF